MGHSLKRRDSKNVKVGKTFSAVWFLGTALTWFTLWRGTGAQRPAETELLHSFQVDSHALVGGLPREEQGDSKGSRKTINQAVVRGGEYMNFIEVETGFFLRYIFSSLPPPSERFSRLNICEAASDPAISGKNVAVWRKKGTRETGYTEVPHFLRFPKLQSANNHTLLLWVWV